MDALRQPNLDRSNSSSLSSIYTKTPQTPTSSTFPYKYRLSSSSFNGYHSKCKVPTPPQALPTENSNESVESNKKLIDSISKGLIRLAAAVAVCLDSLALTESLTIAFPASHTHGAGECCAANSCRDLGLGLEIPTNNGEMHPLRTADAAYSKIKGMLSTLGDRFTRIISPKFLLSCVEGSPTTRAGIHVGDELIEINGERVKGISGEAAAQKLRGYVGTSVTVKVHNSAATDMKHAIGEFENQGVESYILDL
ncbi:unnamed protein product [Lactuca saligna]|uniref:PDZ domain-containing protein n=1 Tax=Lactuca saligna TaxID=75948 RepID=A0AA35YBW6_LACSI|nr:unnamed protein product [Lactuca saligna]